ncbi:SPOR domain-containing protein [Paenibacillus pabuli]|uniref:SPOR domain-containing protein n=1 Tax=Paenibacillus pabuli TaxID=1472 RepID=UPI003CF4E86F
MSNARMTFRFGDNESDKPENRGISTSNSTIEAMNEEVPQHPTPLHSNTAHVWSPEDIPVDWGETMLTGSTVPVSYQRTDKGSEPDDFDSSSYNRFTAYPGEEDEDRSDENYGDHNWLTDNENYSYKRNRPPRGWKMIGSVTGALVTGALFGVVILSFFNREAVVDPGSKLPENQAVSAVTGQGGGEGTGQQAQEATIGGSYYALQYGVFSSPERAEQAKVELSQAGIAAGSDPEDGNRVYAGISADREEAKLLSSRLKAEGVELYVKEIVNPEVNPAVFGGKAEDVQRFFTSGSALIEQLSTLSIQQLGQSVPAAVSSETMSAVQNQHQLWLTSLNSISPGLSSDVQPYVSAMEKSMTSAVNALAEFNKNPANVHMWSVQSDLMEYVLQQKKWLEAIKQ